MTTIDVPPVTRRRSARPAYAVSGAVLAAIAIGIASTEATGFGSVAFWAVFPDVALLAALGGAHAAGQLPPRAVPLYNALHHPALPLAVLAVAAAGMVGTYWAVASLSWLAHIGFDRASGYGLRTKDGWQRG